MEIPSPNNHKLPAPRTRLNVQVVFRRKYAREDESGQLKNISQTGAFLATRGGKLVKGSKVHILLDFLGHRREIVAEIVWSNSNGAGIRFLPHVGRDKLAVRDFIDYINEQKSYRNSTLSLIFKKVA
jgi:hypothetical protein